MISPVADRRNPAADPDYPERTPLEGSGFGAVDQRSLFDDVNALIDDGKTYLRAELTYQKTRAAFVADSAKSAVVFGAVAALLGFLALIGLTVGLILALAPFLTIWGSSALVVALLLLGAFLSARVAAARFGRVMGSIQSDDEPTGERRP